MLGNIFVPQKPKRSNTLTNLNEKVAVPKALQQKRRESEAVVNETLVAREGELVLAHWYDMEEHREVALSGGIKNKYPYERSLFGQHLHENRGTAKRTHTCGL